MSEISIGMQRVAEVAERVGIKGLAQEAGLPYQTVRSFRARGWKLKSLATCDALIAAANRLEPTSSADA
jgi:hypothetical protein